MHIPVMKNEVLEVLRIKKSGVYIDATFGQGGHSRAILEKGGLVLAIDRDIQTEKYAKILKQEFEDRFFYVNSSFANIYEIWEEYSFPLKVDGILFDFGFSSNQIEDKERGFSFLYNSNLDMRYDQTFGITALNWLNCAAEAEMAKIFWEYGEEKNAKKIAKDIVFFRKNRKLTCANDLNEILKRYNFSSNHHYSTKIFQAIRIHVNSEFEHIEKALQAAKKIIKHYGRIAAISFHSLEDRLVKNLLVESELILPTAQEILDNKRARSAKLRYVVNTKESGC